MFEIHKPAMRVPLKAWFDRETLDTHDWAVLTQMEKVCTLPWVYRHAALMPDGHVGIGSSVGAVVAFKGAVSPAITGVDIGCGMSAVRTSLKASDLPDDLTKLRHQIERDIPVGFNSHKVAAYDKKRLTQWDTTINNDGAALFSKYKDLDAHVAGKESKNEKQLGTLGGGNHFIELCLDEDQQVWMMLHSGSRNVGKELAEIHITKAQALAHNLTLVDRDMAVFLAGTPEMKAYRHDLFWAQTFAMLNRRVMFALYKGAMLKFFPDIKYDAPVLCHHNYVAEELHFGEEVYVTRKGAINASAGAWGVIPGSMGTRSYIVRGLGNPESFNSASHGAGRKMSRGAAKRTFTVADLAAQTEGVCCRKDQGVLDEIPSAYKNIEQVMKNQADLVEIKHTLKQVLCIKG